MVWSMRRIIFSAQPLLDGSIPYGGVGIKAKGFFRQPKRIRVAIMQKKKYNSKRLVI